MNSEVIRKMYPRSCTNEDDRVGTFWLPFIAGAAISAPIWYVVGTNKEHNQTNPMYYPYQPYSASYNYPYYFPYPPYNY